MAVGELEAAFEGVSCRAAIHLPLAFDVLNVIDGAILLADAKRATHTDFNAGRFSIRYVEGHRFSCRRLREAEFCALFAHKLDANKSIDGSGSTRGKLERLPVQEQVAFEFVGARRN